MTTRIYSVQADSEFYLVDATTKQAALRHVAEKLYEVRVVDQKTLVAAIKDGVQVEVAGAASPVEPEDGK